MILPSGKGFNSFNKNNSTNYSGEKKNTMTLSVVSIFLEDAKNLSVKSCTHGGSVLF